MGVKEKREAVQRRSKAILVEMMYLPLKKRLKSTDVRRVRVNYGLVACGACCKKPALCCFLTLMVNCVTWKTERHVNKPLLFPVMAVMVRRQVTRQQLRAWMVPDNSLNEVQTCMTLPPTHHIYSLNWAGPPLLPSPDLFLHDPSHRFLHLPPICLYLMCQVQEINP